MAAPMTATASTAYNDVIPPVTAYTGASTTPHTDAWDRYLEAPTPSVEPPQGPQDPTVEGLDEMDPLGEEREQYTTDAILF